MRLEGPPSALQRTSLFSKKPSLKYQSRSTKLMSFWISLQPAWYKMAVICLLLTDPERTNVR